jgi:DNA repair exonuclease SbcCD ATPase subunit
VVRRAAINDHAAIERDLIRQLSECDLGLQSAQHDVDDINRQIDSTMDQLGRHGSFIAVTPAQIVEQHACVRAAKRDLDACAAACAAATATITDLNARLDRVKAVLTKDDPKQLKERLETLRALERDVATLTHAHSSAQADLQRSRRSLKTLESVPCGDAFPTCRFISDAHADRARSTEQELAAANAALRLADVEALLAQASTEHAAERLRKHEQAVQLLAQVTLELEKRRGELARETDRMLVLRSAHDKTVMELEVLLAAQQDVENVQVVELKAELDRLRTRSRELDGVRMRAAAQQGRLHSEIEKCRRSAIEHAELETQLRVFDLIASGCSKRGIPHTIVAAELPIINAEILRILHGIVDFTVELVSDDDGNAMDVFINYGDSRRLLETGSGMEKFISSIAIRVALINVSSLPKTDTLIIDEGFGSLDDTAREAAGRLLHSLKRYFRSIIVITHEDEIKDAVDNVLEITRIEKDSMVVHQ